MPRRGCQASAPHTQRERFVSGEGGGKEAIFRIREDMCDFTFINTFVDQDFVNRYRLFVAGKRLNKERMVWEYYVKSRRAADYRRHGPATTAHRTRFSEMTSDRRSGQTVGGAPHSGLRIPDLKPLADQLIRIAQHLREGDFGEETQHAAHPPPFQESVTQTRLNYAEMARRAYATRRKRAAIFGNPELFGEPAWDILLDLYIAFVHEKPVSVSSACIGSAAPPTTGLRWLGVLAEHGLVAREQDPDDQRRVLVRLTERGANAMDEYFATAPQP